MEFSSYKPHKNKGDSGFEGFVLGHDVCKLFRISAFDGYHVRELWFEQTHLRMLALFYDPTYTGADFHSENGVNVRGDAGVL